MRPFRGSVWGCALAVLAAANGSAQAAWNNVFQVCCHNCRSNYSAGASPVVAYAAPAADPCCPQPCPQQTCTTRYVQRCYYQPVTTYKQVTYMEPVTTYRTSYYYEQVCSYRYSCYYDPCTCSYQSVAQPVTSYRLRSQCCPVTSYLQRCALQPVTSYQQMSYYEPVTTCCTTTTGAPVTAPPPGAPVTGQAPAVPAPSNGGMSITEQRSPPVVPRVEESREPPAGYNGGTGYERRSLSPYTMPRASDQSYRRPQLQAPVPMPPPAPINARIDRIASRSGQTTEGRLEDARRAPQAGARILFVSAEPGGERRAVTTDRDGRFQTRLASGGWIVYLQGADGKPVYNQRIEVQANRPVQLALCNGR